MSGSPKRKVIPSRVIRTGAMSQYRYVNGVFVEDADDDVLLDPQACFPIGSAKHRDSRPRRLDKVESRWFQAEENSADQTGLSYDPSKALVPAISLLSIKCSTC